MVIRGTDEIDSVALNIDLTTCDRSLGGECATRTKEDLKTYLGRPELIIFSNRQRFNNMDYTDDCIVSESVIWNQHVNKDQANWMQSFLNSMSISDEILYLDIGLAIPRDFYEYEPTQLGLSYSDDFEGYYKIAGFTVFRSLDTKVITRSVYDILNFLGDVGGLEGILLLIGGAMVGTFSGFAGTNLFMTKAFYTRKHDGDGEDGSKVTVTKEGLLRGDSYS